MLEFIAGTVALFLGGMVLLALIVALPVLLIVGLFKLLFGLILLPFRLLGLVFGVVAGLFLVLFKIGLFFLAILQVKALHSTPELVPRARAQGRCP